MTLPYCGAPPLPAELWDRWNLDPALLAFLVAGAALSAADGLRRPARARMQIAASAAGWALLAILLVSPLCALSSALFSVRVGHHVALMALVAPLFALVRPARGAPGATGLAGAFLAHLAAVWLWHAPAFYGAALASDAVFWAMEASLLGTGWLLWRAILAPAAAPGPVLLALLGTVVGTGFLGALITFAPRPLYAFHAGTTAPFGLSALEDQQLAGLVMWVGGALPYLAAALVLAASRLSRPASRLRLQPTA